MEWNDENVQKDNHVIGAKTFPIPFPLAEINDNITIISQSAFKLSKEEIINKAFKFHSQGNISEAKKYYQSFIDRGYKDHKVFSNYGNLLKAQGELKDAEILQREAIKLKPDFAIAYSNLAILLRGIGKLEEAEFVSQQAINLNPKLDQAYLNLGVILKDSGKLYEAEKSIRKAIKINPYVSVYHTNLGVILKAIGKENDAKFSILKAIELDPDKSNNYLEIAHLFLESANFTESIRYLRSAIRLEPEKAQSYINIGLILNLLGQISDSNKELSQVNKIKESTYKQKLEASIFLLLNYFILADFEEFSNILNEINMILINQNKFVIDDKSNIKTLFAFLNLCRSLYKQLDLKENISSNKHIVHIGDSHCLSFAHHNLLICSESMVVRPLLILGAKAWHFASKKNNQWKAAFVKQIKNKSYSDYCFISFGEIDCRKNEGILSYSIKYGKDLYKVCIETINGYLDYMEVNLSKAYSKRFYFGVPAPLLEGKNRDELDFKRIDLIKYYNLILKQEVLSKGSYFLDVYELTSNKYGENNKKFFCDRIHLSPKCFSILFENHLYTP